MKTHFRSQWLCCHIHIIQILVESQLCPDKSGISLVQIDILGSDQTSHFRHILPLSQSSLGTIPNFLPGCRCRRHGTGGGRGPGWGGGAAQGGGSAGICGARCGDRGGRTQGGRARGGGCGVWDGGRGLPAGWVSGEVWEGSGGGKPHWLVMFGLKHPCSAYSRKCHMSNVQNNVWSLNTPQYPRHGLQRWLTSHAGIRGWWVDQYLPSPWETSDHGRPTLIPIVCAGKAVSLFNPARWLNTSPTEYSLVWWAKTDHFCGDSTQFFYKPIQSLVSWQNQHCWTKHMALTPAPAFWNFYCPMLVNHEGFPKKMNHFV